RAILLVAMLVIVGGLAVLTGFYFLTRALAGAEPPVADMSGDTFLTMSAMSSAVGILFMMGANQIWNHERGSWRFVVVAALVGLVASIAVQLTTSTGFVMIGVSWIATLVSIGALVLLFSQDVKDLFED
ncbi:MAG: hypothetical protein KAW09_10520, partial [Thermoplasmata archaeon]|nr:hypothetical protein [Thermoplasmata archaeon]